MNRRITQRITGHGAVKGGPLFREHGKQVATLCWRAKPVLEVLLITSLKSRRWILPKGWLEPNLTAAESAAREAFEEAGITGKIDAQPIGQYHYLKEKKDGSGMPCRVDVFALAALKQLHDWPEKGARDIAWLPLDQAAVRVAEPGLRQILKNFRKQHAPQTAARRTG